MRLEHHRICTWNSEVEIGKTYLYTEGNRECKVKVVQTSQQKEGVRFNPKVTAKPHTSAINLGEECGVVASWNAPDKARW